MFFENLADTYQIKNISSLLLHQIIISSMIVQLSLKIVFND